MNDCVKCHDFLNVKEISAMTDHQSMLPQFNVVSFLSQLKCVVKQNKVVMIEKVHSCNFWTLLSEQNHAAAQNNTF